eukprot:TRINITY_DN9845_c0_g1_i1.p1 TRINITY_DN9845_c0_g1~~TRINITY_DN9845_c0_g1_i1.p1  ORF type:complete len:414 (-),score=78.34 TRINITY_DN9845_c0_g1_i1:583-1824(-)
MQKYKVPKVLHLFLGAIFVCGLLWIYVNITHDGHVHQMELTTGELDPNSKPSWDSLCDSSYMGLNVQLPVSTSREGLLDRLLFDLWYQRAPIMKYNVESLSFKRVNGSLGYLLTFNPGRSYSKRRTPAFSFNESIALPFDPNAFNFRKLLDQSPKELLLSITEDDSNNEIYCTQLLEDALFINVNPITLGHFLIVPDINEYLPQVLTHHGLKIGVTFASQSSNPNFFVIFNSQGAFASVNHLHLQTFYAPFTLPLVKAATKSVKKYQIAGASSKATLDLGYTVNYPINGIRVQIKPNKKRLSIDSKERDAVVDCAWKGLEFLQSHNIPHSVLITDFGKKVYLMPRLPQSLWNQTDTSTPGSFETAGIWVVFTQEVFDAMTETTLSSLLSQFAVPKTVQMDFLNHVVRSCAQSD